MSKQSEREFFNQSYATRARAPLAKYYAITRNSDRYYKDYLRESCAGKVVLEYGCGMGSNAFWLAEQSARIVGIDISDGAIEMAREKAARQDLRNVEFQVMDAERMSFEDGSFDVVCGTGILHHLDVETSLGELARVLRPDGKAIFMEPLGHNPALNLFRRVTPKFRTPDEHPLLRKDIKLMRRYFRVTRCRFFHLFSFGAIPFLPTRVFFPVLEFLDGLDRGLFRLAPILGYLAWYAVITLEKPRR
jgi:ubiquinone/menaquinone biosynthesis C-methylase UbiE